MFPPPLHKRMATEKEYGPSSLHFSNPEYFWSTVDEGPRAAACYLNNMQRRVRFAIRGTRSVVVLL